uniref:Ribosome biogenesis protein NOP53 n=1 Tax=Anopheles farauti TaxID=69004 RepID=A0A182QJX8_9DIPT
MSKKHVSRKLKSSWRKHIDITDVEQFLEDQRQDERAGDRSIPAKADVELYSVEKQPTRPKATLREIRRHKFEALPRSLLPLVNTSNVPDPIVQRNVKKNRNTLPPVAQPLVRIHKKAPRSNISKSTAEDIWARDPVPETLSSEWIGKDLVHHTLRNTGKPLVVNLPERMDSKERYVPLKKKLPHSGSSYNPAIDDYLNLKAKVVKQEMVVIKKEDFLDRNVTQKFVQKRKKPVSKTKLRQRVQKYVEEKQIQQELNKLLEIENVDEINKELEKQEKTLERVKRARIRRKKALRNKIDLPYDFVEPTQLSGSLRTLQPLNNLVATGVVKARKISIIKKTRAKAMRKERPIQKTRYTRKSHKVSLSEHAQATFSDVEHLLLRLYHVGTSNDEKAAVERQLEEYRRTTFNWRISIMHLETINNHYLWFFMASTVERVINYDWSSLSDQEHLQIRQMLVHLYSNLAVTAPSLQRNKIAAMITNIAQRQPAQFGEFVQYVQSMLLQKFILGIGLIGAINDNVLEKRGEMGLLQRTFVEKAKEHAHALLSSVNDYCALFVMIQQGKIPEYMPGGINNASCQQNVTAMMDVLQQCFSWMRLIDVDASIISNIAYLARGWETNRDGALGALTALSELLYRNESLIAEAGRHLAVAVHDILNYARQKEFDELFHDKVCEFIRQYIKRGWPYGNPTVDITIDLVLENLLHYTNDATNAHTLMERFHVWTYVCGLHYGDIDDANTNETVWPGLVTPYARDLIRQLLRSLFFRTYRDLAQLDNNDMDENGVSERGRFVSMCIDLIMRLLDVFPDEMNEQTIQWLMGDKESPYRQGFDTFFELVDQPLQVCQMIDPLETLPDYLTGAKMLMRLCSSRFGRSANINSAVYQVITGQLQLFVRLCSGETRPAHLCTMLKEAHQLDLSPLFAQLLSDLKQYMLLGPPREVRAGSGAARSLTTAISDEAKSSVLTFLPLFLVNDGNLCWREEWKPCADAAVDLLHFYVLNNLVESTITNTSELVFQILLRTGIVEQKLHHLDPSTAGQVQSLLCLCLLDLADGFERSQECPSIGQYLSFLASTVLKFADQSNWARLTPIEQGNRIVQQTRELVQFTTLLKCVPSTGYGGAKRIAMFTHLYPIVSEILGRSRQFLLITTWAAADPVSCGFINALLEFCYTVVNVLHSQLDVRVMQNVLELLHEVFTAEQTQGVHRLRTATTMLRTLRQLVQQPHNRTIMPNIIRVALQELLPAVGSDEMYRIAMSATEANRTNEDVDRYEDAALELFHLLHDLLHFHWKYFVDTNPLTRLEPVARTVVQPEAFTMIMNAYENILKTNNGYPAIVKQVLQSIEMLGTRRMLFLLPLFSKYMLEGFLLSLLILATSNQGAIHQEQIIKLLHEMTRVEPARLNVALCDRGIQCDIQILQLLQRANDFPSFKMVLNEILNNARIQA